MATRAKTESLKPLPASPEQCQHCLRQLLGDGEPEAAERRGRGLRRLHASLSSCQELVAWPPGCQERGAQGSWKKQSGKGRSLTSLQQLPGSATELQGAATTIPAAGSSRRLPRLTANSSWAARQGLLNVADLRLIPLSRVSSTNIAQYPTCTQLGLLAAEAAAVKQQVHQLSKQQLLVWHTLDKEGGRPGHQSQHH